MNLATRRRIPPLASVLKKQSSLHLHTMSKNRKRAPSSDLDGYVAKKPHIEEEYARSAWR
jgi:hypothetical protein